MSDIDLSTAGPHAGRDLQRAEAWMAQRFGTGWSEALRMNFYTEPSRLLRFHEVLPGMEPKLRARAEGEVSQLSDLYNAARQLRFAHGAEAVNMVLARYPNVDHAEAMRMGKMTPAEQLARRNELLTQIDAMVQRYPTLEGQARIQAAMEITRKQMEANLNTVEAYISPAAVRQVMGKNPAALRGFQAYDAASANLSEIMHILHETAGDAGSAARRYELYKYISRFCYAAAGAGESSHPARVYLEGLAEYVYNRNRGAQGAHYDEQGRPIAQKVGAHLNDEAPSGHVTDAFVRQTLEHFLVYAQEALPRMRAHAAGEPPPPPPPSRPPPVTGGDGPPPPPHAPPVPAPGTHPAAPAAPGSHLPAAPGATPATPGATPATPAKGKSITERFRNLGERIESMLGIQRSPREAREARQLLAQMQAQGEQGKHVNEVKGERLEQAAHPDTGLPLTDGSGKPIGYKIPYAYEVREFPEIGMTAAKIRLHLAADADVSAGDLAAFKKRVQQGVDQYYNIGHSIPGSMGQPTRFHVEIEFVNDAAAAHQTVRVSGGQGPAYQNHWFIRSHRTVLAHEIGHHLGLVDEYPDHGPYGWKALARSTPTSSGVHHDQGLMTNFWRQRRFGLATVDPRTHLADRYLDLIGGDIAAARGKNATPEQDMIARITGMDRWKNSEAMDLRRQLLREERSAARRAADIEEAQTFGGKLRQKARAAWLESGELLGALRDRLGQITFLRKLGVSPAPDAFAEMGGKVDFAAPALPKTKTPATPVLSDEQKQARLDAAKDEPKKYKRVAPYLDTTVPPLPKELQKHYIIDENDVVRRRPPKEKNLPLRCNEDGKLELYTGPEAYEPDVHANYLRLQKPNKAQKAELDRLDTLLNKKAADRTHAEETELATLRQKYPPIDLNTRSPRITLKPLDPNELKVLQKLLGKSKLSLSEKQQLATLSERFKVNEAIDQRGDATLPQAERNKATEKLGHFASDAYVADAFPAAKKVTIPWEGAGTLDLLYDNRPKTPSFIMVEAKGGSATNSASRDVKGTRVQQGRIDYAKDVITQMLARTEKEGNTAMMKTLVAMMKTRVAIYNGKVQYLEISQKMNGNNLGDVVVRSYQ